MCNLSMTENTLIEYFVFFFYLNPTRTLPVSLVSYRFIIVTILGVIFYDFIYKTM
jgi:CBS domain containing-hemolysin-like protein